MNPPGLRSQRSLRPPPTPGPHRQRRGKRYALAIGINDYAARGWKLANARNDAEAVALRLEDAFGFEVTRLFDQEATRQAIRGALIRWRDTTGPDDDLLLFFAGHGETYPRGDPRAEGYLLPADADQDLGSWLPEGEIIERAREMRSQRVFLVFDACYSGSALRLSDAIQPGARDDQVLRILVAGTEDQPVLDGGARDHSVFTRAFLDGLDGLADVGQEPDGVVTARELIVYVQSEVPWRSRMRRSEQTPVGGALQGTAAAVDFEFRPIKARLSAAVLRNLYSQNGADRRAAAEQLRDHRDRPTAELAAWELIHLLQDDRPPYGREVMSPAALQDVRAVATASLGALGHPLGFAPLTALVHSRDPDWDRDALRATAAASLGVLAARPQAVKGYDLAVLQRGAVKTLIDALQDASAQVWDAATEGLGHLPEAVPPLMSELRSARSQGAVAGTGIGRPRWQPIVKALAAMADRHPDDTRTWPSLDGFDARLLRRIYLARLRLHSRWRDIIQETVVMGLLGAFGLAMAYLVSVAVVYNNSLQTYGLATLAIAAPVGFLSGGAFALLPRLSCGGARRAGPRPPALGALCAGFSLGAWMWVPNWFLGIGCTAGCAWYNWLLWFVPGLAVGPLLGLALVWLHWRVLPAADSSGGIGEVAEMILSNGVSFAAVTLIAGLGMAVVRSLPWLTFPHVESLWPVTLLWGLGGAILGAMLAVGWYITLPTSGWFITWPVGSRPTVTLGGLWWVLLGRRLPGQTKEERNEQVDPGASVRHSGPDRVPGGPSPDHPPR